MTEFERFVEIVSELRSDHGCPWDKEQTHGSLKRFCIEESAEVIAGIDIFEETGNSDNLCEELGDLLLQIVLHAQIASEEGLFTIDDVVRGISEKMIRRHPHVFANTQVSEGHAPENGSFSSDSSSAPSMQQIHETWDEIKQREKAGHEWMDSYLPKAFEESAEYLELAKKRKEKKLT